MNHLYITFSIIILALCAVVGVEAQTLVTPPASIKTTTMKAQITSVDFYGSQTTFSRTLTVGNAEGYVYIQGLCDSFPDAWVKGKANKEKTSITFAQEQYVGLAYDILDVYFFGHRGDAAKHCDLTLQRNLSTGVLSTAEGYGFGEYYYDDLSTSANKYVPYMRYASISITPSSPWEPADPADEPVTPDGPKEPVVVPTGAVFKPYTLSANSFRTGPLTHPARLAFVGDDVYMDGFCSVAIQTNTCVKGRREGSRLVFPKEHFIVNFGGSNDMYLYGATYYLGDEDVVLADLVFDFNPVTDTYTGQNGILISQGKFTETGLFSEYLQNPVLQGNPEGIKAPSTSPKGESLLPPHPSTSPKGESTERVYDLQGRSLKTSPFKREQGSLRGILIHNGRKLIR